MLFGLPFLCLGVHCISATQYHAKDGGNNNNNNNNNGLLTVYPPSGSSPVKNYNIYKKRKTIIYYKNKIELKSAV